MEMMMTTKCTCPPSLLLVTWTIAPQAVLNWSRETILNPIYSLGTWTDLNDECARVPVAMLLSTGTDKKRLINLRVVEGMYL